MSAELEVNKIILGDAYELIKQIPDKSIDLIITDPPYEFNCGSDGSSKLGQRKAKQRNEIVSLDTKKTKQKIMRGAGCFGSKKAKYYSEFNKTDNENEETTERFISNGIENEILEECVRVLKKINIYIWCSKLQLRQILNFFGEKQCSFEVLTWHKSNPIPTCNGLI